MTLRDFIDLLQREGRIRTIDKEVSPHLEAAAVLAALEESPVLFKKLAGSDVRGVGNLFATRELLARSVGLSETELLTSMVDAQRKRESCPLSHSPACQQKVWMRRNLRQFPVLKHIEGDGGPYVTTGIMIVDDKKYGRNAAFHRLLVLGKNRVAVRVVEGRHSHQALQSAGGKMDVAVCIGAPPHVMLAAAMSPPAAVDELEVAQELAPTPLARCLTSHLQVPADCEIVLEGRFTGELADEGPFIDLTGTWDIVRRQPVMEIDTITSREEPIYEALLPGKAEHRVLMGVPREADIFRAAHSACRCVDVRVTPGGCSWLHAVVVIEKQSDRDPGRAIEAAFQAHPSLKRCVVVDSDIDPTDPDDVEWALATRYQADRDNYVFANQPSSSLDPSATHAPGKRSIGAKLGMDATVKRGKADEFRKVPYPLLQPQRLQELLGD